MPEAPLGDPFAPTGGAATAALVSIGVDGRVLRWDDAAEQLFGWTGAEARGRELGELIVPAENREAHRHGVERFGRSGAGRLEDTPVELVGRHRDGSDVPVELRLTAVRDGQGNVTAFDGWLRDVRRRRADRAGELARTGIVDSTDAVIALDREARIRSWNPGAEALFGYRPEEIVGSTPARLHVEGERDLIAIVAGAVEDGEPVAAFDLRQLQRDGSVVDTTVAVLPIGDGATMVVRDTGATQEAERHMRRYRELMERSFENAPIGMAMVDRGGRVLAANPALLDLLGMDREQMLGSSYIGFVHPGDRERVATELSAGLEAERLETQVRALAGDGSVRWLALNVALVRDASSTPEVMVAQVQDITEGKESEVAMRDYTHHLSQLSNRDPLTGLCNQRGFEERLASLSPGTGRWSLALFDIDGFRRLNALRGLGEGDAVLRTVAETLTELSREEDVTARVGADEFALVLGGASAQQARCVANRVAALVAEHCDGVTLSVGVAEHGVDATGPAELLAAAATELSNERPEAQGTDDTGLVEDLTAILDLARDQLGMAVACIARIGPDSQSFDVVSGDTRAMGFGLESQIERGRAMIADIFDGRMPALVPDADAEPSLAEHRAAGRSRSGSYVALPLEPVPGEDPRMLCAIHPVPRPELGERELSLMQFLARIVSVRRATARARAERRQAAHEMAGVHALLSALGARDHYTGEHSNAVVALAAEVGSDLGLDAAERRRVEQVALLHDIGKVGIPDSVLQKRGPLTEPEWELMRQHPAIGSRIVSSTPPLAHLAPDVRAEHERWDGGGYPDGLAGEAIPRASRIVFACDAFHAMTSDRPYRRAMAPADAAAELRTHAGTQFDPDVVRALLAVIDRAPGGAA